MYQGKFTDNARTEVDMSELNKKASVRAQIKAEKKAKRGTVMFYSIYGFCVASIIIALLCVMAPLRNWLVRYEASQPEQKAQEVFNQLFADADWANLYTQAGMEETSFETKDVFAAYMDEKVGDAKLTYIETSAGLSGDHKYIVKLGDEKIATFRLTGGTDVQTEISTWELGTVELFFARNESVTVEVQPEQTVYINGIALDDSYIIRTITTRAEEYLPEGVHGYRAQQLQVKGLLKAPEVTVKDKDGNEVAVTLDEETGIYKTANEAAEMTEEYRKILLNAGLADGKYALRAISKADLRQHFDGSSQIYADIVGTHPFLQDYRGYVFDDSVTAVSDFYRYSDKLISGNVTLLLKVTRTNGTIKEIPLSKTYFMEKKGDKFLVTQYTNVPVQEQVSQVRLTFLKDGEQIGSQMAASNAHSLTLPQITAPEGQEFKGWAVREEAEGKVTMTILFTPAEDGTVQITSQQTLEPMELHAVFEAKETGE